MWTATWLGRLGGTWELVIADERGDVVLREQTATSTMVFHPLDGFVLSMGVRFAPCSRWRSVSVLRFERPVRPLMVWRKAPATT